jgi:hypothetical protein
VCRGFSIMVLGHCVGRHDKIRHKTLQGGRRCQLLIVKVFTLPVFLSAFGARGFFCFFLITASLNYNITHLSQAKREVSLGTFSSPCVH